MQLLNKTSNTRKTSELSSEPFLGERHRTISSKGDSLTGEASTLLISSSFKASQIAFASSLPYPDLSETTAASFPCGHTHGLGGSGPESSPHHFLGLRLHNLSVQELLY